MAQLVGIVERSQYRGSVHKMAIYQLDGNKPGHPRRPATSRRERDDHRVDVTLGERVSILFGAVVRGDNEPVTIGDDSNVQDNCVPAQRSRARRSRSARASTIGHQSMLHGCTIGDGALIGIEAVVLNQLGDRQGMPGRRRRRRHRAQELPRPLGDLRLARQGRRAR